MYTCQSGGFIPSVPSPSKLRPLTSELEARFQHIPAPLLRFPPRSQAHLPKSVGLHEHQRLVSTWSARPSQSSSLHSKSPRAPVPSSIRSAASIRRNLRQLCRIREFGDLQFVLSATQFINLDLRFTLTSLGPLSTITAFPPTRGFRKHPEGPRTLHRLLPLPRRTIVDIFQHFAQNSGQRVGKFDPRMFNDDVCYFPPACDRSRT